MPVCHRDHILSRRLPTPARDQWPARRVLMGLGAPDDRRTRWPSDQAARPAVTRRWPDMPSPLADDAFVHKIITAASAAPSIHNTQPWRFRLTSPDIIEVHADLDRMLWTADPLGRALHLSCGAALFNLRTAIRSLG